MILILSDRYDSHADYVVEMLEGKCLSHFRMNLDVESLLHTSISLEDAGFRITQNTSSIHTSTVHSIWPRRVAVEVTAEEESENRDSADFTIWKNEWNKVLRNLFVMIEDKKWLNSPNTINRNENKLRQLILAEKLGFNVPPYCLSNDKSTLVRFAYEIDGEVVIKLQHQDFYKVENQYVGFYVNKVNKESFSEFQTFNENPLFLQKYIEKQFEVRYTVVGDSHFPCKIDSQRSHRAKIDWRRYDISNTPHYQMDRPALVSNLIDAFMSESGLTYGAFDFIVDENGKWYFLEVNTTGQWLWIEHLTGMRISHAIIDVLST